MADNQVNIIITATNKAKAAFADLSGDLNKLQDDGKATKAEIAAAGASIVGSIVAIGTTAVTRFADFEAAMSKVKAVTNIAGAEMEAMTALARDLGATTVFTAQEVAEAMAELGQAGFTAAEIMVGIPATLDLAAAGGLEIARATEIASSTLRGFQLETTETTRVVDIMAKTAASSNATIEDFGESMKYLAPTAHAFGISIEEASAVVGVLSNAGIKGSLATRALGTALARLTKPTDAMVAVMDELQVSFFNTQGEFVGMEGMIYALEESMSGLTQEQRMSTIATLFGAEAIQEINVLLAEGSSSLGRYTQELMNSEGEAKRMAETMLDNLKGSFEQLNGAIDDLWISLGKMLAPAVSIVAQGLTILAQGVGMAVRLFEMLPTPIQTVIKVLVGIGVLLLTGAAAWASMTVVLSGFWVAFTTIITGAVAGSIAIVAAFWPVIAILGVLALAGYALYKAWTDNFLGLQSTLKTFVDAAILLMMALRWAWENDWYGIQTVVNTVWGGIMFFLQSSLEILSGLFKIAVGLIQGDWTTMWTGIKQIATVGWEFLTLGWEAWHVVMERLTAILKEMLFEAFESIVEGIKLKFTVMWEGIQNLFKIGINQLIEKMNKFIRMINPFAAMIGKAIGQKGWSLPELKPMAHGGILPVQNFAHSGILQGARGTDTTMYAGSPGEVVLNYAHQAALASALRGRGGRGDLHIHLDGAEFNGSGREFAEEVADKIWRMASPHISHEAF